MIDREPLIIHHAGCSDGICGAMVIWLGLGRRGELLAAQYGDEPPGPEQIVGREVWIVDFSYPRDDLMAMNMVTSQLTVIDHHKTAAANCEGLEFCEFDMERSGARMALDHMIEIGRGPLLADKADQATALERLVNYVQDRDLWQWELQDSGAINAWLASFPRTLDAWLGLVDRWRLLGGHEHAIVEGFAIQRQNRRWVEIIQAKAWTGMGGDGIKALIVNSPILQSEVAGGLAEQDGDHKMGVAWWQEADGTYIYSLRSRPNGGVEGEDSFDVSGVAERHGGGGHRAAAGFKSPHPPGEIFIRTA